MKELITDKTSKQRFWQIQRKAQGLCQCCGAKLENQQSYCGRCKARKLAKYRSKHPLSGSSSCSLCHQPGHNKTTCPKKTT